MFSILHDTSMCLVDRLVLPEHDTLTWISGKSYDMMRRFVRDKKVWQRG